MLFRIQVAEQFVKNAASLRAPLFVARIIERKITKIRDKGNLLYKVLTNTHLDLLRTSCPLGP